MDFFDQVNISERFMEILNPTSTVKILTVGEILRLKLESRVIDFGCGFGETLALWGTEFGISGIGIDVREYACERARNKMHEKGLKKRIEIVCANGAEYPFEKGHFNVACCIGATFIWKGYEQTIHAMKEAIVPGGRLVIGEPYWNKGDVPAEYVASISPIHNEFKLLETARREGFDLEYVVRASQDDWDTYEAGNWFGSTRWLEENPTHPERQQVIDHLHKTQDAYFRYGREYLGWAMYILHPRL
jgi:SAM-dependent methyltransferase